MEKLVITKKDAQRNLTLLWAGFTLLLSAIFFVQTVVNDKYLGQHEEVWDWFIPLVFPTLTLMVGALVAVAQSSSRTKATIDKFYYRLTLGAISVYFLTLLIIVLSAPIDFINTGTPAFAHLKKATKLISALQAVVTLVLGIFFFKESRKRG